MDVFHSLLNPPLERPGDPYPDGRRAGRMMLKEVEGPGVKVHLMEDDDLFGVPGGHRAGDATANEATIKALAAAVRSMPDPAVAAPPPPAPGPLTEGDDLFHPLQPGQKRRRRKDPSTDRRLKPATPVREPRTERILSAPVPMYGQQPQGAPAELEPAVVRAIQRATVRPPAAPPPMTYAQAMDIRARSRNRQPVTEADLLQANKIVASVRNVQRGGDID